MPAKPILIVKLWAIGDIVMATPLIPAIRSKFPDAHIAWIADARYAEILKNADGIDELIPFDASAWQKLFRRGKWISYAASTKRLRKLLAHGNYDVVLNLAADKWWAFWFNVAKESCGLFYTPNSPWMRFYTKTILQPHSMHTTKFSMLVVKLLGCSDDFTQMRVGKLTGESQFIEEFYNKNGVKKDRPVVVISPFSSTDRKDWPGDRFAEVADHLTSQYGAQVVLSHAPVDIDRARKIEAAAKSTLVLSGSATLLQYAALLRAADMVVCNDSSALHIAAAVETPLVAIFGPTLASEKAPLHGKQRILTPGGDLGSVGPVGDVSLDRVIEAVDSLMHEVRPAHCS